MQLSLSSPQADQLNCLVRILNVTTGAVKTVAGIPGIAGFTDGVGTAAGFNVPQGIAVDETGAFALVVSISFKGTHPGIIDTFRLHVKLYYTPPLNDPRRRTGTTTQCVELRCLLG